MITEMRKTVRVCVCVKRYEGISKFTIVRFIRFPWHLRFGHFYATDIKFKMRERNVRKFQTHAQSHSFAYRMLLFSGVLVKVVVVKDTREFKKQGL